MGMVIVLLILNKFSCVNSSTEVLIGDTKIIIKLTKYSSESLKLQYLST